MNDEIPETAPAATLSEASPRTIQLHDIDGSHAGYAAAMLRAHFAEDTKAVALIRREITPMELLRSSVEVACAIATATIAQRPLDGGERQRASALVLTLRDHPAGQGEPGWVDACVDLSEALLHSSPSCPVTFRLVHYDTILSITGRLLETMSVTRGIPLEDLVQALVGIAPQAMMIKGEM